MQVQAIQPSSTYIRQAKNQTNNDIKSQNTQLCCEYIENSTKITFLGGSKNLKQIAIFATECVPYGESGGLGAVTRDMTKAYKQFYPDKDLRLFLPFYNSSKTKKNKVGNLAYEISGVKAADSNDFLSFELSDTGIKTNFKYGVRESTASLYKINNPENGVPTYLVEIPELSNTSAGYGLDDYSLFEKYAAFSYGSINLLRKTENSIENFNPSILHTKDWHTAFSYFAKDAKEFKKVHELSNANANFHGKIQPLAAALNLFNEDQINRLLVDSAFKKEIFTLSINNQESMLQGLNTKNLHNDINSPDFLLNILKNLANNYKKVLYDKKNFYSHIELNNSVRNIFKDINWDENMDFNATVNAIKDTDAWFTVSKTHFKELMTEPKFSSGSLYNMLRLKHKEGAFVPNKIDLERYNPANPQQVESPYNVKTYKSGKSKNKDFIYNQFSRKHQIYRNYSKKLINNQDTAKVYGYLDEAYKNAPLIANVSRFDTNQKGSDIVLKAAQNLLESGENINFVFALPDICKHSPEIKDKFIKEIVENPKYLGRVVLIDAYVPINQYVAAADFSIIPSRSETCGLVGYQSMRMGAVPIATPVGSMNDYLITPQHDIKNAMGFKTSMHFMESKRPDKILENTIREACMFFDNEKEHYDRMVKNCMHYNSDWTSAIIEQNKIYESVINGEKLNNINLNELKPVESRHGLKFMTDQEIESLEPAEVLVVLPHSDDEIFFTPLLKDLKEGKKIQMVYSNSNDKGHYRKGAPSTAEELSKHRSYELLEALNALGITRNPIKLNIPDMTLSEEKNTIAVQAILEKIIEKIKPQKVMSFGPDGITGNPDHRKIGEITFNVVRNYKSNIDPNVDLYQTTLSQESADKLKAIMSSAQTDSFDFVSGISSTNPIEKTDMKDFSEQIMAALKAHESQWSDLEAKGLHDFYSQNGAELTKLKEFPQIQNPRNPWLDRQNHFSNMYGKEFTTNGKEIFFKPEGANYSVNLYLSDFGKNTEHLWIDSNIFNSPSLNPNLIENFLKQIHKAKNIPQFQNVKYVDLILNDTLYPNKKIKVIIPLNEVDNFTQKVEPFIQKEGYFANYYFKLRYPESQIQISKLD